MLSKTQGSFPMELDVKRRTRRVEGISHIAPGWSRRVPRPRLRHLVPRPTRFGALWVLWLYAQIVLFVIEVVLLIGWGLLVLVLSAVELVTG